jgi:hypothetical protein
MAHEPVRRFRFGRLGRSTAKDGAAPSGWCASRALPALGNTRDGRGQAWCVHQWRRHRHAARLWRYALHRGEHPLTTWPALRRSRGAQRHLGSSGRQRQTHAASRLQSLDPVCRDAHGTAHHRRHEEEQLHERCQSGEALHGSHEQRRILEPYVSVKLGRIVTGCVRAAPTASRSPAGKSPGSAWCSCRRSDSLR